MLRHLLWWGGVALLDVLASAMEVRRVPSKRTVLDFSSRQGVTRSEAKH